MEISHNLGSPISFLFFITSHLIFCLVKEKSMGKLESDFQHHVISRLNELVGRHGYILNLDGSYIQGFPDILVLYKGRWAALECKKSSIEKEQPNQRYYIEALNHLSFASFIYPAIEDEVINDLQQALRLR